MNSILVSIIIATYRRQYELDRAIKSACSQTHPNCEIIVVDDNDNKKWNDSVKKIVSKYSSNNIRIIENHPNQGSAKTRNIGIQNCNGDYITFLDDDDVFLPERVTEQLSQMVKENGDYGITNLFLYNENDELVDKRIRNYICNTDSNSLMKYHIMHHMTGTDTLMFHAPYLRKIGGFPEIDIGDEYYLMEKAILEGGTIVVSDHCFVKAYVHTGATTGLSSGGKKIQGENRLYEEKKKYFSILSKREIKYIKTRHHAVLAFAYVRDKNLICFIKETFLAVLISPFNCWRIVKEHK